MRETLKKFDQIAADASKGRRPFKLFALFRPEGREKWDLVVSASWLNPERRSDFEYMSAAVRRVLAKPEWLTLAGTTILPERSPLVARMIDEIGDRRGFVDLAGLEVRDEVIRRAYVVEANATPAPERKKRRAPAKRKPRAELVSTAK